MKHFVRSARLLLLLAGLGAVGCDRGQHPGMIGKPAPEFVIADSQHTVDLNKLRGHIVVLNLWASFCAPCVEELPSLLELQKRMPGITVVAVSIDQDEDVYRKFLLKHHVDVLPSATPTSASTPSTAPSSSPKPTSSTPTASSGAN